MGVASETETVQALGILLGWESDIPLVQVLEIPLGTQTDLGLESQFAGNPSVEAW
eukprot:CAMPEP_0204873466 /NCGR_PEP_ID=MMETSP1348-20121228/40715_1 /ASSEMBLY_ACC=CAM_ASM_000700 /TAXON_ID=215587 /ORGANISM="Aplanochytrium stocchinoi, Strain GSBS06" /LENGTH=54 /DNA_ID=CAMNT_0052028825 /DNA_START=839 /DNA_END=1000 /DNA_ORIENTATION=-